MVETPDGAALGAVREAVRNLNNSGFPLQVALRDLVDNHADYSVESDEHRWAGPDGQGFADLLTRAGQNG